MGADNQAERVIANIEYREKIFASHDRLLATAKRVIETQDDASRRDGDARHAIERLKAAIEAAP